MLKNLLLYFTYRATIKANLELFTSSDYALRKDFWYRLYTVINIPTDIVIDNLSAELATDAIKKYVNRCNRTFLSLGLGEMIQLNTELSKEIDKHNYLIVFDYKLIDMSKVVEMLKKILTVAGFITIVGIILMILSHI